uniref:Excisionase n=1 Tax=Pseudomonas phage PACT201 TaxID=3230130 RepID=A0AAU8GSL1_9VIRU
MRAPCPAKPPRILPANPMPLIGQGLAMSLISVEAAAGILGVSRRTAYRYADEKLIPVVRFKTDHPGAQGKARTDAVKRKPLLACATRSAYRRKYAVTRAKRLRLLVDLFQISNRKAC